MDRNIYETTRPAVTEQYYQYLSDDKYRKEFDKSYIESKNSLLKSGFDNPSPHLFGDSSLKKRGIPKIKDHNYSNF
jgi:hypothetical protein